MTTCWCVLLFAAADRVNTMRDRHDDCASIIMADFSTTSTWGEHTLVDDLHAALPSLLQTTLTLRTVMMTSASVMMGSMMMMMKRPEQTGSTECAAHQARAFAGGSH
jgi:hypothetical protein